jgi:hypothetical protein
MVDLIPVDHDPFAPQLIPVDHNPFLGDPEAAGAAQVSQMMEPVTHDLSGALGIPNALEASNRIDAERPYQPGMTAGQMMAPDWQSNPMLYAFGPGSIKAFHGSPHDFDAFDMSKIGTGEGAQAYGHGLYFAENEPVARNYRDSLSAPPEPLKFEYKGENVYDPLIRSTLPDDIYHGSMELHARSSWTKPEAMTPAYWDRTRSELETTIGNYERAHAAGNTLLGGTLADEQRNLSFARSALSALNNPEFRIIPAKPSSGKMYEASINADPEHFLDWDKPLSQQSEKVQDAVTPLFSESGDVRSALPGATGESIIQRLMPMAGYGRGGADIAHDVIAGTLRDAGIPGIRYLDQGSRGAGEGSHNYVVFDDKLIDIIRKYGLAGLIAGGAATIGGNADAATHVIPVEHDPFAMPPGPMVAGVHP